MQNTVQRTEKAHLPLNTAQDLLLVRILARALAENAAFSFPVIARLTTALSEIARTLLRETTITKEIFFSEISQNGTSAIQVEFRINTNAVNAGRIFEQASENARELADGWEIGADGATLQIIFRKESTSP